MSEMGFPSCIILQGSGSRDSMNNPKNFKEWFEENLSEEASDIAQHGADAGWPHITYTNDCVKLYNQYRVDIWEMLNEDAEDMGYKTPIELIATFNRIDMAVSDEGLKNLLVWYACERIANQLEERAASD